MRKQGTPVTRILRCFPLVQYRHRGARRSLCPKRLQPPMRVPPPYIGEWGVVKILLAPTERFRPVPRATWRMLP